MHCLYIKVSIKKGLLGGFSLKEWKNLKLLSFPSSPPPFSATSVSVLLPLCFPVASFFKAGSGKRGSGSSAQLRETQTCSARRQAPRAEGSSRLSREPLISRCLPSNFLELLEISFSALVISALPVRLPVCSCPTANCSRLLGATS